MIGFGFEYCDLEFIWDLSFVIWDLKNFFQEWEDLITNATSTTAFS